MFWFDLCVFCLDVPVWKAGTVGRFRKQTFGSRDRACKHITHFYTPLASRSVLAVPPYKHRHNGKPEKNNNKRGGGGGEYITNAYPVRKDSPIHSYIYYDLPASAGGIARGTYTRAHTRSIVLHVRPSMCVIAFCRCFVWLPRSGDATGGVCWCGRHVRGDSVDRTRELMKKHDGGPEGLRGRARRS